jgi:hypothetical protein
MTEADESYRAMDRECLHADSTVYRSGWLYGKSATFAPRKQRFSKKERRGDFFRGEKLSKASPFSIDTSCSADTESKLIRSSYGKAKMFHKNVP